MTAKTRTGWLGIDARAGRWVAGLAARERCGRTGAPVQVRRAAAVLSRARFPRPRRGERERSFFLHPRPDPLPQRGRGSSRRCRIGFPRPFGGEGSGLSFCTLAPFGGEGCGGLASEASHSRSRVRGNSVSPPPSLPPSPSPSPRPSPSGRERELAVGSLVPFPERGRGIYDLRHGRARTRPSTCIAGR